MRVIIVFDEKCENCKNRKGCKNVKAERLLKGSMSELMWHIYEIGERKKKKFNPFKIVHIAEQFAERWILEKELEKYIERF